MLSIKRRAPIESPLVVERPTRWIFPLVSAGPATSSSHSPAKWFGWSRRMLDGSRLKRSGARSLRLPVLQAMMTSVLSTITPIAMGKNRPPCTSWAQPRWSRLTSGSRAGLWRRALNGSYYVAESNEPSPPSTAGDRLLGFERGFASATDRRAVNGSYYVAESNEPSPPSIAGDRLLGFERGLASTTDGRKLRAPSKNTYSATGVR